MKREAIEYFKFYRKIFCEDHLKICPKDSIAYQATLKEKEFYDMAIKALEQEPRWIPVSERLPKVADCYTVTRQIVDVLIVDACYFDGVNKWHDDKWINHERNYVTNIVAWMEQPQPYKPESEEEK